MQAQTLERILLFDLYGDLLTDKQRDCFDLHYNQDLSLSEIAELRGTSRQGVYDAVSRAEAQLLRFEQVTHSLARERALASAASTLAKLCEQTTDENFRRSLEEAITQLTMDG